MSDGLLDTRADKTKAFLLKSAWAIGPSLLLAAIFLALGGDVVALVVVFLGGMLGLSVATSVRTVHGAAYAGLVVAAALFALQIVVAWFASHPILPGS